MKLLLSRAAEWLSARGHFDPKAVAQGYSIDSRTIRPGELFFAVKGERLDGHDFVLQALEKGAIGAVVGNDRAAQFPPEAPLLRVEDTLAALQALAAAVRRSWGRPVVGVTGSTGKTTTKEAIAHVLSTRFRVLKSEGNFNNHFGLPLMLLKLEPEHQAAVIEMGMSHPGEIAALAKIAQPEIGVVTNIAPVHLEFFQSLAEIAQAKYELIAALPPDGTAVLNADDEYVSQFARHFQGKVIRFGLEAAANVRAENVKLLGSSGSTFDLVTSAGRDPVTLHLVGRHNIYNALAAVAVGVARGLSAHEAAGALATLSAVDKRGAVVQLGNMNVINDCYNSNPVALNAMVDVLANMPAKRRIVVAGEMLELGASGEELHRFSGRHMVEEGIDILVGVRGLAQAMVETAAAAGMKAEFVSTPEEAGEWLSREVRDGDVVLLKASRGVQLERALEKFTSLRSAAITTGKAGGPKAG